MNIIILVQLIFVKKNISCYYILQNVLSLAKAVSLERSKSSDIRSDHKSSAWLRKNNVSHKRVLGVDF
jgi:hypothetical protein